ncbi:MAG: BatD family protein, partial [Desulfobacterales bacterium]
MKSVIWTVKIWLLIALALGLAAEPVSAEMSVSLSLDRSEATPADTIQMKVTVAGSRDRHFEPRILGLENFTVTPGGTSSRIEFINGKISARMEYTYFIQPRQTGIFQVGPAEVEVGGQLLQSQTTQLRVVPPAPSRGETRGSLFLSAELAASEVYVDEQTVYILKLCRRARIENVSLQLPEAEHLVFQQLGEPREYRRQFNGQDYQVLEVRYALAASQVGTYTVGPARMKMTVLESRRRSSRSLFDDPFFSFSSGRPVTLASETVALRVRGLPEEGRPGDFSGLVGRFEIDSELAPAAVKTGNSATLTVQVRGHGNVKHIPDLKLPAPEHLKVYADQPVLEITPEPQGLTGTKTMKWALVPEQ